MTWTELNSKDNRYASQECQEFVEKYCNEKGITSQELANDVDHFDLVLNLFDEHLKSE
jgi:hypothetical protein